MAKIPFTSERVLKISTHPFVEELRPRLHVSGNQTEGSATIVWDYLDECDTLPAMWNILPFHPHQEKNRRSNRTPGRQEVVIGREYLERMLEILTPDCIIAVGAVAAKTMLRLFPDLEVTPVRHPSRGGKEQFLIGIEQAGVV